MPRSSDPDDEDGYAADEERPGSSRTAVADPEGVDALAAHLRDREVPFALATVVRREAPVSAHVGDRAVITTDGSVVGWIGGVECAQSVVVEAAERALHTGEPVLLGLAPDPESVARPGLVAHEMTCHSGGTLEVFVEPVGPLAELVIVGNSAVARSLTKLAEVAAFDVTVVDPEDGEYDGADRVLTDTDPDGIVEACSPGGLVVVASMGAYDERGVAAGVRLDARYLGLVASDARADAVIERAATVIDRDPAALQEAVTCPAGLDIGAETPAEIATSILAELIDVRRTVPAEGTRADSVDEAGTGARDRTVATDPVCGMAVPVADPPATAEHGGETYYFCCPGCADAFRAAPTDFINAAEG